MAFGFRMWHWIMFARFSELCWFAATGDGMELLLEDCNIVHASSKTRMLSKLIVQFTMF